MMVSEIQDVCRLKTVVHSLRYSSLRVAAISVSFTVDLCFPGKAINLFS